MRCYMCDECIARTMNVTDLISTDTNSDMKVGADVEMGTE